MVRAGKITDAASALIMMNININVQESRWLSCKAQVQVNLSCYIPCSDCSYCNIN